jgi:hypothetical protein
LATSGDFSLAIDKRLGAAVDRCQHVVWCHEQIMHGRRPKRRSASAYDAPNRVTEALPGGRAAR